MATFLRSGEGDLWGELPLEFSCVVQQEEKEEAEGSQKGPVRLVLQSLALHPARSQQDQWTEMDSAQRGPCKSTLSQPWGFG